MFTSQNSLNGLQTTTLFKAPADGLYFVNGQLQLPSLSKGATGNSEVVVTLIVDGDTLYTGAAGDTGFQANLPCSAADVVTVTLASSAAPDLVLNAVTGVVGCGNAF